MRRSSIIGPLILIAIGVIFLIPRVYPNVHVVDILGQYWPFLLIGWGVLRLIEVLAWAMSSKPLPRNGVTGGEWALVILICVVGFGAYKARHSNWWHSIEFLGDAHDYPFSDQKAVGKTPRILIESFRGDAKISGSDVDEVRVSGRKTVQSLQQSDADKANLDTPFEIAVNGDDVIIRTNQGRASDRVRVSAAMEITIPKGAKIVDARGLRGDFDISDLSGDVEITSDNAGVRILNLGGNLRVDTRNSDIIRAVNVKGSVELKGRGGDLELENIGGPVTASSSYSGSVQLKALSKSIRFLGGPVEFSAEGIPGMVRVTRSDIDGSRIIGPIRVDARSRDVQLSGFTQQLELSVDRGHVDLRPGTTPLPRIDVKTHRGDIDISLPDKAKLDLVATTDNGDITNEYDSQFRTEHQGRAETLRGGVGDGPRVSVVTDRGAITIRKSAGTEEAVTFPSFPTTPEPPPPAKSVKPPKPPVAPKALQPTEQ